MDTYSKISDSEWVDDGENEREESDSEDSEDEEESCKKMASLYSIFLPRHLRPKITEFHDERPVCIYLCYLTKILKAHQINFMCE